MTTRHLATLALSLALLAVVALAPATSAEHCGTGQQVSVAFASGQIYVEDQAGDDFRIYLETNEIPGLQRGPSNSAFGMAGAPVNWSGTECDSADPDTLLIATAAPE